MQKLILMTPTQLKLSKHVLKITTRELAKGVNLSFTTINAYETYKREMKPENIKILRKTLEEKGIQFLKNGDISLGSGVALKSKIDKNQSQT